MVQFDGNMLIWSPLLKTF